MWEWGVCVCVGGGACVSKPPSTKFPSVQIIYMPTSAVLPIGDDAPADTVPPPGWSVGIPLDAAAATRGYVVLIGWYGALDRHLKKYSDLLEGHGYCTARCVAPTHVTFGVTRGPQRDFARRLLCSLKYERSQRSAGSTPVAFFCFSNGGAFIYRSIIEWLRDDAAFADLQRAYRATVFDSAPCFMHASTGANALTASWRNPVAAWSARVVFLVLASLITCTDMAPAKFWAAMREDELSAATLYLYSMDDPLCDGAELTKLIEERRALVEAAARTPDSNFHRAKEVACKCWPVSEHVGHLRKHPDEYKEALLGFLAKHMF